MRPISVKYSSTKLTTMLHTIILLVRVSITGPPNRRMVTITTMVNIIIC